MKKLLLRAASMFLLIWLVGCGPDIKGDLGRIDLGPNALQRIDNFNHEIAKLNQTAAGAVEQGVGLDQETLQRIDALNSTARMINNTMAEGVGLNESNLARVDELTLVAREINGTIANGFGLNNETLVRVDRLVAVAERGFGLDAETREVLNRGIDAINNQPFNWRFALNDVVNNLRRSSSEVAKEVAAEVQLLLEQAARDSQRLVQIMGIEGRCNVDFLTTEAEDSIDQFLGRSLVNRLKEIIGEEVPSQIPTPWACHISPNQVLLVRQKDVLVAKEPLISVIGYNFVQDNLPEIRLISETGQAISSVSLVPYRTSAYEIQVNVQGIDFQGAALRSRLVFSWPNTLESNAIAMLLPPPEPPAQVVVTANTLNVRRGPGTNYEIVGHASHSERFEVIGKNQEGTWWQIGYNGGTAWVSAKYAYLTSESQEPPVVTPEPAPAPAPLPPVPPPDSRSEGCTLPQIVRFEARPPSDPKARFALHWVVQGADRVEMWQTEYPHTHTQDFYQHEAAHWVLWAKVSNTPDSCFIERSIWVNPDLYSK